MLTGKGYQTKWTSIVTDQQHRHDRQLLTASLVWSVAHACIDFFLPLFHA